MDFVELILIEKKKTEDNNFNIILDFISNLYINHAITFWHMQTFNMMRLNTHF